MSAPGEGRVEVQEERGRAELFPMASVHAVDDISRTASRRRSGLCASPSTVGNLSTNADQPPQAEHTCIHVQQEREANSDR